MALSVVGVLAGPAGVSVPAANAKFCKAANNISTNTSGKPTKSQAKTAVKGFKNAAKYAPTKVKSAINNIAKFLGLVSAGAAKPERPASAHAGQLQELHEVDHDVHHLLLEELHRHELTSPLTLPTG